MISTSAPGLFPPSSTKRILIRTLVTPAFAASGAFVWVGGGVGARCELGHGDRADCDFDRQPVRADRLEVKEVGVRLFRLRYRIAMTALTAEEQDRVREALGRSDGRPRITTGDGTVLDLPEPVAEALAEVLAAAAEGERALVLRSPDDLTTEQAAAVLGVSRPTVVRMIEAGKLPARMVGTHRRLTLGDVLAYREASATRRRDALDRMANQAEELGLYD